MILQFHLTFLLLIFQPLFHGILCDDRDVLLSFKSQLMDPRNALSAWTSHSNSSHCTWYGVSCSKNTTTVQSLSLGGLGLSGELPSHLFNLTYLQFLDLSNNAFHGPIPFQFSHLSLLQTISLAFNNLSGSLPSQLSLLKHLQVLDFSVNYLTGQIPPQFGSFSSLTDLSLARNQLSGEIPSELGNLQNLSNLQFSENYFTGEGVSHFHLQHLFIGVLICNKKSTFR